MLAFRWLWVWLRSIWRMHKLYFGFASVAVGKWSGVTAGGESVFSWLVDADENALLDADGNILTD